MSGPAAPAKRSKWAVDINYRLWDNAQSCWVVKNARSMWQHKGAPERLREEMIEKGGRNPDTLSVERVFVEVK